MRTFIATIACLLLASQAQAQTCCGTRSLLLAEPAYVPQQQLLLVPQTTTFSYVRTEQFLAPQTFSYGVQPLAVGGCGLGLRGARLGVGYGVSGFGFRDPLLHSRGFIGGGVRVRAPGVGVFVGW